ncbi:unnamed protein product [Cylicocyclus nassatus]|uniref:SXP/RAL-2 family protein Ani s 5-like cation-binding domain-containing protein n=1 Tax=Cylicocyclus nassatus TaxID=53992 RepID=A0AA36H1D4_CYLNA|nr:unnamed protein product [Cylicocyclus nassatus]
MKIILYIVVLCGGVLHGTSLSENEKILRRFAGLKKAREEIIKEVRANVYKLVDELNEALNKQIAVVDDKSKSPAVKLKALWELQKENPKASKILRVIFEQFVPKHFLDKQNLNETEKARWKEIEKEARANATKLISELKPMLKKSVILDFITKAIPKKLDAFLNLMREKGKTYTVVRTLFEQFNQFYIWRGDFANIEREKINKEMRAKVTKLTGELNEALDRQIAIIDDKSKTFKEKLRALLELTRKNPKVYRVLQFIFEQFTPKRPHFEKYESLSETEKAEIETVRDEIRKEVWAKVAKIIGELNATFIKKTAILDDKSKTFKEKLEALWALRKENPEVYDILWAIYDKFIRRKRPICRRVFKKPHMKERTATSAVSSLKTTTVPEMPVKAGNTA